MSQTPPRIPPYPSQLTLTLEEILSAAPSDDPSPLEKDIDNHADQLLTYAIQLIAYRQVKASEREAKAINSDRKTEMTSGRRRELHALYDSTGLREQICHLLIKLAGNNIPPTPYLLDLVALLDAPGQEPSEWRRNAAARLVAQIVSSGSRPNAARIAEVFDVDPHTIRRWLNDPEFKNRAGWTS
jgi:hypothetical protein